MTKTRKEVTKVKKMITKKMTKTKKKATKLKETITKKGMTKTKKGVVEFKKMVIREGMTRTRKKAVEIKELYHQEKMNSTRKGTNCFRTNTKPQELPHIVVGRKQLEEEHKLTNAQFSCATIPAHKP
jgi:hypothetical protein